MIIKDYTILSPEGIHARPATTLIKLTKQFKSVFHLKKGDTVIKLNSMLNILALAAKNGETISIIVEGEDEAPAAAAIEEFFTQQIKNL
ncbi:MAG TPA: HPr family phosphocarrier protein [Puia sp.]|jgi:phosphocarrier protein|nr:HPr family phosphocarrier protein [Puia sp.]